MTIGEPSKTPIYRQIAYQLIGEIQSGVYQPGDRLPSENQLATKYQVHRLTIRHALNLVIEQRLAFRHQGKGTFVTEPRVNYVINQHTNFTHNLRELGYLPCLKILEVQQIPATEPLTELLEVSRGRELAKIKLLRTASPQIKTLPNPEFQPLCISLSYLPLNYFPEILAEIHQVRSLYSFLRNHYGIEPRRTRTQIETSSPSQEDIDLLKIPVNVPILITRGVVRDLHNRAIEYTISRFRGDRFTLEITG